MSEFDPVYYRLYLNKKGYVTVLCMQSFDEYDYSDNRFVRNSQGEKHKFDTEAEAIKQLNEWFKIDEIDPEYRQNISLVKDF
jgi:hypothetical protein